MTHYTSASLTVGASGSYTQTQTSDYFARNTYLFGTLASPGGANIDDGQLFGDGTVNGSVINSSRVFPSGKLTINGDYTQAAGGTLEIDRSDRTRTGALDVPGNAMLDGTLSFVLPLGYVPLANASFAIPLDVGGSVSGNFTNIVLGVLNCPTCTFDPSTLTLNTGSVAPTKPTVVPEPASLLLFGTGLLGLGWVVRRKTQTRVRSNLTGIV